MDRITRTLSVYPGAHVYHFGHYEPTTFELSDGPLRHAGRRD